jgi:hypothetical protein
MRLSYRAQWTVGNFLICAVSMTEQIDWELDIRYTQFKTQIVIPRRGSP